MRVQSRAIRDEIVVLWGTLRSSGLVPKHLTLRHVIMGVQRAVKPEQLRITAPEQEKAFLGGFECDDDEATIDDDGLDDDDAAAEAAEAAAEAAAVAKCRRLS